MEFWAEMPGEPYDFGIWIAVIPPGRWKEFTGWEDVIESTGDGSCEHLPFFVKTLEDFIRLNPGKTLLAGAADTRRENLYRIFLKRFGFIEYEYGYSWHDWAMVLKIEEENND